ncbi:MAG: DUF2391 family protein [Nostoc sp.]
MTTKRQKNIWKSEINDIIRGACGGLVDRIAGQTTTDDDSERIDVYCGLLAQSDRRLSETQIYSWLAHQAAMDTVKAIAIGLACSTFILLLLRELTPETSLKESCCLLPAYWASRTTQIDFMNQIRFRYNSTRSSLSFNFSF